ncbi:MAG: reverse transcriptase domain-containing protein [Segetibacter sp.]
MVKGRSGTGRWQYSIKAEGTPQGGVISPLLANLYLHHAFDMWMGRNFPSNPFERYADDIIVHCSSKAEAENLLVSISERLKGFELELNAEKTKLVYCKNHQRKERHEHESFTFLSYSFQPRRRPGMYNPLQQITVFTAAISCRAKAFIRQRIREVFNPRNINISLHEVANRLNPKIRGWLNYYCKFNHRMAEKVFEYLNGLIRRWMSEKYKLRSEKVVIDKYREYVQSNREQFVHWQKGIIF